MATGRCEMGRIGDRAVVPGASMAGLLAGRVLAGAYTRVTVTGRDGIRALAPARGRAARQPQEVER